uniref:DNA repair protein n=1 Tax=Ignisphaera aggregans TaxID=334771 RepID=A0A832CVS1_9CREN
MQVFSGNTKICIQCKGYRRLCGLRRCLLSSSSIYRSKAVSLVERGYIEGSTPPTVIVGERGYPLVRVYFGVPPGIKGEKASFYDNPNEWIDKLNLEDVIDLRSSLILVAMHKLNVYTVPMIVNVELLLAGVSLKPVDTEVVVEKFIRKSILLDSIVPPLGPSILARNIRVTGNPNLPKRLEKIIDDDLRAFDAVIELYNDGTDFYTIARAFSLGLLGLKNNRKAVPTRWSITAVDQSIGNHLLSALKLNPPISNTLVFYNKNLYNKYLVILAPGTYKAIWIEVWHPSSAFNPSSKIEYLVVEEFPASRYTVMDGGYIAARTSILEYLHKMNRQAKVAIIREILPQYI